MTYPCEFSSTVPSPVCQQLARQCQQPKLWQLPFQTLSDRHLDINFPLENKANLVTWCQEHCSDLHPSSFVVDELNIVSVAEYIGGSYATDQRWVVKPVRQNNGQGIFVSSTATLRQDFQHQRHFAGKHVIQRCLLPALWEGKAFTLRLLVVITRPWGGYFWPNAYINQAREDYDVDRQHTFVTNEHQGVQGQRFSRQRIADEWPHFSRDLRILQDYLRQLCQPMVLPTVTFHPKVGFWGVDFMWDSSGKPWLLEINHGPCFPGLASHPLQGSIYQPFWHSVMLEVIEPLLSFRSTKPRDLKAFL